MTATGQRTDPARGLSPDTATPPRVALTLPERVRRHARLNPAVIALRHKDLGVWQQYTWRDYAEHTARAGLGFLTLGIQPGDRIAVLGDNRPEWIFADLGAQGVGAIVVGVYATSPAAEIEYILEHSGAALAVVEDEEQLDKILEVRERLPSLREIVIMEPRGAADHVIAGECMTFERLLELGQARPVAEYDARVDALDLTSVAVLVYTSGTTGPPKGAMLTHGNLHAAGETWGRAMETGPGDELLSYLPLCHIAERLLSCIGALARGYRVNFGGGGEALVADLREVQPTLFFGVPRVWEKMLATIEIKSADASWLKRKNYAVWMSVGRKLARKRLTHQSFGIIDRLLQAVGWVFLFRPLRERLGLTRVRWAGCGAAPIAPPVLEFFWAIGVPIRELYGQTEGTALATWTPPDDVRIGSVGKALPGVELRIADDGEVLVRSAGVFAGYYRNDEATRATVDADGWLHSGDVGVLDTDGFLTITDRKKDIIITSGGKNISPSWIENLLKVSPYVREAIVIGDRRKYLTALIGIELDTVGDWATRQRIPFTTYKDLSERKEVLELIGGWVNEVNEQLAQVERVKRFRMIPKELDHEEGELTATQKVKRRAIAQQFAEMIEGMYR